MMKKFESDDKIYCLHYLLIHDPLDDFSELFYLEVFFCTHHRYAVLDFWIP